MGYDIHVKETKRVINMKSKRNSDDKGDEIGVQMDVIEASSQNDLKGSPRKNILTTTSIDEVHEANRKT